MCLSSLRGEQAPLRGVSCTAVSPQSAIRCRGRASRLCAGWQGSLPLRSEERTVWVILRLRGSKSLNSAEFSAICQAQPKQLLLESSRYILHLGSSPGNRNPSFLPKFSRVNFHNSNQLGEARLPGSRKEIVQLPATEKVLPVCQKREPGSRRHVFVQASQKLLIWTLGFIFLFLLQGLGKNKLYSHTWTLFLKTV